MLRALHEQFRNGTIIKTYTLVVHGVWPAGLIRVDTPLTRFIAGNGERRVKADPAGKQSLTGFEVIAKAPQATLLEAELHTGRTHQIRVHACESGHSIVGDEKYASATELESDRSLGIRRLCLHASRVEIPTDTAVMSFESPLPRAFEAAWKKFETAPRSASSTEN